MKGRELFGIITICTTIVMILEIRKLRKENFRLRELIDDRYSVDPSTVDFDNNNRETWDIDIKINDDITDITE